MGRPKKNQEPAAITLNEQTEAQEITSAEEIEDIQKTEDTPAPDIPKTDIDHIDTDNTPIEETTESKDASCEEKIPENIDQILKIFSNKKELHIGVKGGIYSSEYKEFNTKKYINPYYKE